MQNNQTMKHPVAKVGDIIVPRNINEMRDDIVRGSGIVCFKTDGEVQKIYYEGNINGACNLNRFDEKVVVAAGRAVMNYPTVARTICDSNDYDAMWIKVGEIDYDPDSKKVFKVSMMPEMMGKLAEWAPLSLESYAFQFAHDAGKQFVQEPCSTKVFMAVSAIDAIAQMEAYVATLDNSENVIVDHLFQRGNDDFETFSLLQEGTAKLTVVFQGQALKPSEVQSFCRKIGLN